MSSISGFSETWLLEFHDSFGSIEDLDKALSGATQPDLGQQTTPLSTDEVLSPSKTLIALYRPGLSYRPDQAIQSLPKMRYFDVTLYHIRPGTESDFARFLKLRNAGLDSLNLDRPDMAYQIISGERAGTYIVLTPLPSLRVLDDGRPATPSYAEGDRAAANKIIADSELVRERLWFRIEPRVSSVSDEFADGDNGFWHPRVK
jgi:hypothetical protein